MNQLQLLDLPPAWLGSMILALPNRQLRALFRTCSQLQQLTFSQSSVWPKLLVRPASIQTLGYPFFAKAIAMAEAAEAKLMLDLWMHHTFAHEARPEILGPLLTSAAALIHPAQQPEEPPAASLLTCITAVNVHGLTLAPDVLFKHCPNLQLLDAEDCTLLEPNSTQQLTCSSLQKLNLWSVEGPSAGFKHLLNLPNLTALELYDTDNPDDYEEGYKEGGVFWAAISKCSSQLRGLACNMTWSLPWSPTTQLPQLEQLILDKARLVGDAEMRQLLAAAPIIKDIKLRSIRGLSSSFAQVPCSWQQLKLDVVYVAELAKLPLSSCTRLECLQELHLWYLDLSPEQITAGVAAAQAAGGLHFSDSRIEMPLYDDDLERLTAAGPLLQHLVECMYVDMCTDEDEDAPPWSDWQALFAVLGQHLKCRRFEFFRHGWRDYPGSFAQAPDLLPHVKEFSFWDVPPEAEVIQMVRSASRPFVLELRSSSSNLVPQLQQVMQEAGHQLVTLTIS